MDCGFECIAKPKCASFNVAANPDSSGSFLCELLETGMYCDSGKPQGNASFHHYSQVSLIYTALFLCRLSKETNNKIRSTQLFILYASELTLPSGKWCGNLAYKQDLGDIALASWANLQLPF